MSFTARAAHRTMSPAPPPKHRDRACPDIVTVNGDSCTASVDARFVDRLRPLLAAGAPDQWPTFSEVKRSTVRRVLRGSVGDLDVHVKLYRTARWTDRARDLLQGARARVEFENLRSARARDLATAEPIAFGIAKDADARSFLVTRTIPHAEGLPRHALPPAQAAAVGQLLRRVHDAGLLAFDLHPENVLVDADQKLWLVDLTSARFGAALAIHERARGLAFFLLELDGGPAHSAALPLLDAYGASPALRTATAKAWRRLRQRALAAFGRRATRACKHTAVDAPMRKIQTFRHLPAGALADGAVQRESELSQHAPLKSGRRGAVWILDDMVAKQRNHAAARRLFTAAYWLTFAGIPCAQPLALVERPDTSVVLVERIPGLDLAARAARHDLSAAAAIAAAARLGTAVGRLHAHGLRNRDLKLENLMLHPSSGEVVMVDLDGVRHKSPTDRRGQANDLGRLLASFRTAGSPGTVACLRAFLRGYTRARQCQGHRSKIDRPMRRRIEARASGLAKPLRPAPS